MNLTQLVIGSALGFFLAQGVLYALKRAIGWLKHDKPPQGTTTLTPSRESAVVGGIVRHAGLIAAGAAVITLGAWAAKDYLATKPAPSDAVADTLDASTPAPVADAQASPSAVSEPAPASKPETSRPAANNTDPYADPDYRVHRRAGKSVSLKEKLVRQSEDKARTELLRETLQHVHRSQYDCEAADRASRYVKGDLDVWGFATWQVKYFPVDNYTGATLPQCQAIKNVVDPSWADLRRTTVAQANHP